MRRSTLAGSLIGWLTPLGFGVCSAQPAEKLAFEVASVKKCAPIPEGSRVFFGPARGGPGTPNPGQITWTYATLRAMLMTAFDMKTYQVIGPSWLGAERYDIAVKVPPGATPEQVRIMWQNLLTERFVITLHHDAKEFQVEELIVGKGGPKLRASAGDPDALPPDGPPKVEDGKLVGPGLLTTVEMTAAGPRAHATAKAQPLAKLTEMLGNSLGRPVLDKTGLTGKFDFTIDFVPMLNGVAPRAAPTGPADAASEPIGPDLSAAVQQQLGLRLVSNRAKLEVIVIDKAEKVPTEN